MGLEEKLLDSKRIFKGNILELKLDFVKTQDGKVRKREIVNHPGAVCIAAINEKEELAFVKQYRCALSKTIIELPAGKMEKGEVPIFTAKRELMEETGIEGVDFKSLGYVYVSPGYSTEIIHLYFCKVAKIGKMQPDDGEFLEPIYIKLDKAIDMAINNEINDAKTQICIFKIAEFLKNKK